jgi:hypothetical protein
MNEDNNPVPSNTDELEDLFSQFSMLDYREKPVITPKPKTLEEIKKEFPMLDYDYGTASYYAHKFPFLPDELYQILEDEYNGK